MPTRSLDSSVLRWPDGASVFRAAKAWARQVGHTRADVLRIGCFGSLARGEWSFGSDLDLIVVVADSPLPFTDRPATFDTVALPVHTDLLVYTANEWESMVGESAVSGRHPLGKIAEHIVWLYDASEDSASARSGAQPPGLAAEVNSAIAWAETSQCQEQTIISSAVKLTATNVSTRKASRERSIAGQNKTEETALVI